MRWCVIPSLLAISLCSFAQAAIVGSTEFKVDLTKADEVAAKLEIDPKEKLNITADGLGWDGEQNAMFDTTIITKPIAIGTSWRPTSGAGISAKITPPPREFALPNGEKSVPSGGSLYCRYSADGVHWSNWQFMSRADERINPRNYSGKVGVSRVDSEEYYKKLREYQKLDVPWISDEEAACKWIVEQDPKFFVTRTPFVGYLQCMFEIGMYGGQRITGIEINIGWMVGGMHQPAKDKVVEKDRDGPWRFVGKKE